MQKLSLSDIKIVSEGDQLKTLIKELGGVKSISKQINLSESSIYKSFKRPSDVFKFKLMNLTQKSYGELILTPEDQVKAFVDNIFSYAKYYGKEEDLNTLKEIKVISKNFFSIKRYVKIDRAIAIHHLSRGDKDKALSTLYEILETSRKHNLKSEEFLILCDLAFINISSNKEKALDEIREIVERMQGLNLEKSTFFRAYETLTLAYNLNDLFKEGLNAVNNAKEYIEIEYQKGVLLFTEGFLKKRYGHPHKALELYEKAVDIFEEGNFTFDLRLVLNNMSGIYKNFGDYEKAIDKLQKSSSLLNGSFPSSYFTTKTNMLELKILSDEKNRHKHMAELLDLIMHSYNLNLYDSVLNNSLKSALDLIFKFKLSYFVDYLEIIITQIIISQEKFKNSQNQKRKLLGDLRIIKYQLERR